MSTISRRTGLVEAALGLLEAEGPEALQARRVTAEAGTSTQAVYTLFGGMPDLIAAVVTDGFRRFGAHIAAAPRTDDAVADHLLKGWAYCDWALDHPQMYRLMYGVTGGSLRQHPGLELNVGSTGDVPELRDALAILIDSVQGMLDAGRIRDIDVTVAAQQFLAATHGYVLLAIGGVFGSTIDEQLPVMASMAASLLVGMGDTREAFDASLLRSMTERGL